MRFLLSVYVVLSSKCTRNTIWGPNATKVLYCVMADNALLMASSEDCVKIGKVLRILVMANAGKGPDADRAKRARDALDDIIRPMEGGGQLTTDVCLNRVLIQLGEKVAEAGGAFAGPDTGAGVGCGAEGGGAGRQKKKQDRLNDLRSKARYIVDNLEAALTVLSCMREILSDKEHGVLCEYEGLWAKQRNRDVNERLRPLHEMIKQDPSSSSGKAAAKALREAIKLANKGIHHVPDADVVGAVERVFYSLRGEYKAAGQGAEPVRDVLDGRLPCEILVLIRCLLFKNLTIDACHAAGGSAAAQQLAQMRVFIDRLIGSENRKFSVGSAMTWRTLMYYQGGGKVSLDFVALLTGMTARHGQWRAHFCSEIELQRLTVVPGILRGRLLPAAANPHAAGGAPAEGREMVSVPAFFYDNFRRTAQRANASVVAGPCTELVTTHIAGRTILVTEAANGALMDTIAKKDFDYMHEDM